MQNKTRPFLCIDLLNTFSDEELDALEQLTDCRYFNTDRYVAHLLKVLRRQVFGKPVFSPETQCRVYEQVFPHLPAPSDLLSKNQSSLLNMKMNSLMRLAEEFLSIEMMRKNDGMKHELLYPQLLERRLFRSFNRHIKKEQKVFNQEAEKGEKQYVQKYRTEQNILDALYRNGQLVMKDNLPELVQNLDIFYLLNRLSLQLTALSLQQLSAQKVYNFDLDAIQPLLKLSKYANHPLILLYNANIALMQTQSDDDYKYLLGLLNQHSSNTPRSLRKHFYTICISHCINQVRNGNLTYSQNILELYKIMHHKDLLVEEGLISISMLKNMVSIACQEQEFDWAKQLIEHYRPYIRKAVRESVYQFYFGILAFYQKNYEAAHSRFIQVRKIDTIHDINVRIMIMKCLYETEQEYQDPIMQSFRTAEKFFKTHKSLTAKSRKDYKNFIRLLINLYRIRHGDSKMTVQQIKDKLEQQDAISDKRWLLEKIGELG